MAYLTSKELRDVIRRHTLLDRPHVLHVSTPRQSGKSLYDRLFEQQPVCGWDLAKPCVPVQSEPDRIWNLIVLAAEIVEVRMTDKAEWKPRDFKQNPHPPQRDYVRFDELTLPDGGVIARIEQFCMSDHCFYATTPGERSGCLNNYEAARRWCEHKSGNKVN